MMGALAKPFNLDKMPFAVLDKRLTNTNIALGESSNALSVARGETITRRDVENGLIAVLGLNEIFDLLDRDINSAEILSLLRDCDFARLRPEKLCAIVLEESIVPAGVPIYLTEADVKLRGGKWTVHKYDADPFPSNPHAHNYAQALKLHLANGDLYQHESRVRCGRMERKHLIQLRSLVARKNATIALPPLSIRQGKDGPGRQCNPCKLL
jgi:hypothetical protein